MDLVIDQAYADETIKNTRQGTSVIQGTENRHMVEGRLRSQRGSREQRRLHGSS